MPAPSSAKGKNAQPVSIPRGRRALILLIVPIIGIAIYLNYASTKWVPNAESEVKKARQAAADQAYADTIKRGQSELSSAQAQSDWAKALVDHGQFVPALIPAERAVSDDPKNADAHVLLAMIYTTLGYRAQALDHYQEALKLAPDNLEIVQKLGDFLKLMGDMPAAEKVYLDAHNRAPQSAGPTLSLASLYLDERRAADALALLEPMLKNTRDSPVAALFLGGRACESLGQTKRGADLLREAIRRQPDFADAYHTLGAILCNQAQFKEGIPLLQRATELAPDNASHRYALGNAIFNDYARPDRLPGARAAYEAAIERDPENDWAHYYYGFTLEQLGEYGPALREYDRTLEINPRFDSAWYRKGAVFAALGRKEDARRANALFDQRSKMAINAVHGRRRDNSIVDTAEEHYRRGMTLLHQGDKQKAAADFQVALQRDPNFSPARRALEGLGASSR